MGVTTHKGILAFTFNLAKESPAVQVPSAARRQFPVFYQKESYQVFFTGLTLKCVNLL